MAMTSVSYTTAELKYKMFSKKLCPLCGDKMKPFTKKVYLGFGQPELASRLGDTEQYRLDQYYHCDSCNKDFSISELVKGK